MKKQIGLYLPGELHDIIIDRANTESGTISDTYITLLEHALVTLPVKPRAPLPPRAVAVASPLGRMAKGEHMALAGLQALTAREEMAQSGAFRFDHTAVAGASGLLAKSAYMVLQSLKVRGLVDGEVGQYVDRWGRPTESTWWLPEAEERHKERVRAAREVAAARW